MGWGRGKEKWEGMVRQGRGGRRKERGNRIYNGRGEGKGRRERGSGEVETVKGRGERSGVVKNGRNMSAELR